jgi:hypothetical protein
LQIPFSGEAHVSVRFDTKDAIAVVEEEARKNAGPRGDVGNNVFRTKAAFIP